MICQSDIKVMSNDKAEECTIFINETFLDDRLLRRRVQLKNANFWQCISRE